MQDRNANPHIRMNIWHELKDIENVPTLPRIFFRLEKVYSDPNASIRVVCRLIEEDPPTVAKILQRVNSGYYNLTKNVHDIQQAIVVLGLTETYNLVMELSIMGMFESIEDTPYFNFNQFWKHSSGVARTAAALRKHLGLHFGNTEFSGGLLHDFGRLILCIYFREIYQEVFEYAQEHSISLYEAEQQHLNFTHTEAGFWLAKQWGLPEKISDIMLHHHTLSPEDVRTHPLRAIIHLADLITNVWGFTLQPVPLLTQVTDDPVWQEMIKIYPKLKTFPLDNMSAILRMPPEEVKSVMEEGAKDLPKGTIELSRLKETVAELNNNLVELYACIDPHELTPAEVLKHLSVLLHTYFSFDLLSIYKFDPDTNELALIFNYGQPGNALDVINFRRGKGAIRWIFQHQKPLVVSKNARKSRTNENAVNSFLGMPIISGNSMIGIVALGSFQPDYFGSNEAYLLEVSAKYIANLL